jgi:hypothetical protein
MALAADTGMLGIPGTWVMKESRAGNLCEARVEFMEAGSQGALEGSVTVRSPCVDTGSGVWKIILDGDNPTFGWALDYEKSRVLYSTTKVEAAKPGGTVKASGVITASPRASPGQTRKVGSFTATARLPSIPAKVDTPRAAAPSMMVTTPDGARGDGARGGGTRERPLSPLAMAAAEMLEDEDEEVSLWPWPRTDQCISIPMHAYTYFSGGKNKI